VGVGVLLGSLHSYPVLTHDQKQKIMFMIKDIIIEPKKLEIENGLAL